MSKSGEERVPGYGNDGTIVVSLRHVLQRTPVALERVWQTHWDEIHQSFDHGRGTGYALVLFDDLANIHAMATLSQPAAESPPVSRLPNVITVGRHTQCALRVVGDPAVALRQLVLAVSPGSPTLEVMDLRTDGGLTIDAIGPARSAVVDGAISLSFASMRLVALPMSRAEPWPLFPHHAWQRFFGAAAIRVALELRQNPAAYRERRSTGTLVSLVQPVLDLEDVGPHWTGQESLPVRPRPALSESGASHWKRPTEGSDPKQLELVFGEVANAADFDDAQDEDEAPGNVVFVDAWPDREAPIAQLTLDGPGGRAVMTLTDDDLDRGVVIGRYERCAGHVRGHVFDEYVSRVHALIKRDTEGRVVLIDTGSTFGVVVDGAKTACAELASGKRAWLSPLSSLWVQPLN